MVKDKTGSRFSKIQPQTDREQNSLKIFELLKRGGTLSFEDVVSKTGLSGDFVKEYLDACSKRNLLKVSGGGKDSSITFDAGQRKMLGISFHNKQCILTVVDLAGNVIERGKIDIFSVDSIKGKVKEVKELIEAVKSGTRLKEESFDHVGIVVPEGLLKKNPASADVLSEGMKDIFKCDVLVSREATAAGYGERELGIGTLGKDLLYVHSDIGIGVVIKSDVIFEADEINAAKGQESYLRPWGQFNVVSVAKDFVNKGLGTDIIDLAKGDVDNITLDTVFKAAERKDELAEDLVKRSGLALGVRVAYLANMFHPEIIILGGGIEKQEGRFIQYVQESMKKFVLKEISDRIAVIPGVLGKEAASIGSALLCRREMFMEV